jgi:hypothetical protein
VRITRRNENLCDAALMPGEEREMAPFSMSAFKNCILYFQICVVFECFIARWLSQGIQSFLEPFDPRPSSAQASNDRSATQISRASRYDSMNSESLGLGSIF